MFEALPDKPDHQQIEEDVLALWEARRTFDQLRAQNAEGPRFSFVDGPVTANKALAVHTAWGRTLKDVFQRYKALQGFHQRYQNGFDCQGLWIEVGVEKELGLNSKREIEEFGLAEFARRCRAVVEWSSAELTKGSIRLGQWMDWENSYFTFSDTNITYIWRFLQAVERQGRLYRGHRATEWCPRCGTSISAHELVGSYVDQEDPSLSVRFPLLDRPGEAVVIWTTTPWTLPANVAAAVSPTARYGLRGGDWVAVERTGLEDDAFDQIVTGADMVGWRYEGPYDELRPQHGIEHRVVPWDEVSMDDGTGIVHIAPACGTDDFGLAAELDLPHVAPVDEAGLFYPDFGWLAGKPARGVADEVIADLKERGRLVEAGTIEHRYPECWRCHTPLIFRLSDDWFIRVDDELRQALRDANATVEWTPAYMGKRMDDWLVNMGDWNISRRRYYGLPLPFYPCACGHVTVIGSKDELAERAVDPLDGLEELRRPWIDDVRIRCAQCGDVVTRIPEVGDVWLDAGIVPFSTLGWENPTAIPGGYATGAAQGLTTADLPDHATWEEWFPADWVSEMREQIRLWFYSQLFMSVVLTGRAPYRKVLGYEKMLDETGREMHGSWGNMITAEEAFARMGADVMRWQYCAQPPSQNLLFGYGPGEAIERKLLTLWNSASFFVQYATIEGFAPTYGDLDAPPAGGEPAGAEPPGEATQQARSGSSEAQPRKPSGATPTDPATVLDRWLVARTDQFVAEAAAGYDAYLSVNVLRAVEAYVDDLSNWYIRRSRRRFWDGEEAALRALWRGLVQVVRVVSPVMPFMAEHLWQRLVVAACPDAPESVFLAGWPAAGEVDADLVADVAAIRRVVELGRQARGAANLRVRQPLRRLVVEGADRVAGHEDEIAGELRVKEVVVGPVEATQLRVRPNLPVLGPRLGADVGKVRAALAEGNFEELPDGGFRVAGHDLAAADVLVERTEKEGWAVAADDGVTVALDTELDDDLRMEARVYDLIHRVNTMRKEAGLEITDRIVLGLPAADDDLAPHHGWIAAETLAVDIAVDPGDDVTVTKA